MVSRIPRALCATLLELHKAEDCLRYETVGSEKWITISTLRPILCKLMDSHLVSASDDSQLQVNEEAGHTKKIYMRNPSVTYLQRLDPRFKSLKLAYCLLGHHSCRKYQYCK